MLRLERKLDAAAIARLADGARFAPAPLSDEERARHPPISPARRPGSPATIRNGSIRISRSSATSAPPRVRRSPAARRSICASTRSKVTASRRVRRRSPIWRAGPTHWSPTDRAHRAGADAKEPRVHAEPAFIKGLVEVQDEGSQLAALLANARAGEQVVDLCAGAGGKTLALAAVMEGPPSQLCATKPRQAPARPDPCPARPRRRPICRCDAFPPRSDVLVDLAGNADLVVIDAPCSGTGGPGGAIRMPNGVCGLHRLSGIASRSRRRRSTARRRWSSPAAASPMSPARCCPRRTATRSAAFSDGTPNSPSCRRPKPPPRSVSGRSSSAAPRC